MIKHIDHIGIAVKSIEDAAPLYRDQLGLEDAGEDVVEEQGVRVAFFKCGEVMLELLEPTTPDSPIAKFIERRGEGIHHLALGTDDINGQRDQLKASIRFLSKEVQEGAHGKLITFMHPKDTGGVLLELTQRKPDQ